MTTEEKVKIGSAIFGAQNLLTLFWQSINTGKEDDCRRQGEIERTAAELSESVKVLGGVDWLIENGA